MSVEQMKRIKLDKKTFYIRGDDEELNTACRVAQEAALGGVNVQVDPPKNRISFLYRVSGVCFWAERDEEGRWTVDCDGAERRYSSWGWVEKALRRFLKDPAAFSKEFSRRNWGLSRDVRAEAVDER